MPRLPGRRVKDAAALVRIEAASAGYGNGLVIENVDFAIDRGEIVTLLGPNGGGKSTLVRLALGVLKPERGRAWRRPRLSVGYVPQRLSIDPTLPMTVGRFLDLPRRHPAAAKDAALTETGIPGFEHRAMQALSGGEFQRALLARALLKAPDLVVLDEPAQGVDHRGQAAFYRLIGDLRRRRGCAVLLVSHDLHLVMAATDRVVCMNGHVCCAGTPEALERDPGFVGLFGPAAETLAVYRHRHDHDHALSNTPPAA